MSILNQNLLTLDFWKNEVTYAGHTLPTGSIGCAAMNISDEQIGQLIQLAIPLAAVVELIKDGKPTRAKVVCQQGCFSPLLETQSQGIAPLWTPAYFPRKWYPNCKNAV